jgi:hypothetical protein
MRFSFHVMAGVSRGFRTWSFPDDTDRVAPS